MFEMRALVALFAVLLLGTGCSGSQASPDSACDCQGDVSPGERDEGATVEGDQDDWEEEFVGGTATRGARTAWSAHRNAVIPVSEEDPTWGDHLAPVTIVEFSDFECPFCGRVNPTLRQLKEYYGREKIRIVWKNNPLPFHQAARPAHRAAAAVHDLLGDDAFWRFHDQAFANRKSLTRDNFIEWAVAVGVNPHEFAGALSDRKYELKVARDQELARQVGATGTPAFRINGVEISGAQPFAKFVDVIDAQLEEARALQASGTPPEDIYPVLVKKNAETKAPGVERKPPPPDTTIWALPIDKDDPKKGAKLPLVTIVEFAEFQCPFCKRVQPTIERILQEYPDEVRVVWKDNPLGFHPRATPAARVARAAYKAKGDAGFWKVHDALFDSQPRLEDEHILEAGKTSGASSWLLNNALTTTKYDSKLERSSELAQEFQARGTPHFFVNGMRVKGAQPFAEFKRVIDAQIKDARAMVAAGIPRSKIYDEIMKTGKTPPPPPKKVLGPVPSTAPVRGKTWAKVTIQVFSDFQCPFCSRALPTLEEVMKKHGNDVKLVWRNLPLPFHKQAPLAAEAAMEVHRQKGNAAFWQYHDKLFAGQKSPGLERAALEQYAREIGGINMVQFGDALETRKHEHLVDADIAEAKQAGISGTPGFVVNGYFVSGAQPYGAFKKAIKLALKDLKKKTP